MPSSSAISAMVEKSSLFIPVSCEDFPKILVTDCKSHKIPEYLNTGITELRKIEVNFASDDQ